jgi:HK97 family phage major capsid protein
MAEATRSRDLSFSSEFPYRRWFGTEILDHDPKSVRMEFMESGRAPLLKGHDQRQVIGIIEKARIDGKEKVGRATARFGRGADASDALRDVDDGILVNVSTGYRVHEMVLEKSTDAEDTYRVTDWEPLEASLVGIPADPSVGIGRAARTEDDPTRQARAISVVSTTAPSARGTAMTDQVTAPAGLSAETKLTAIEAERQRRDAIIALCKANRIDARTEARWVQEGVQLTDTVGSDGKTVVKGVASQILDVLEERGRHRPAAAAELGLTGSEARKYSLFRAIRALKFGGQRHIEAAGFEMECSLALAKKLNREDTTSILIPAEVLTRALPADVMQRAMATTPGSKGGYLVNVENMGFIDILRNRSVARTMGARTLSGLEGNVVFGRQTGKPSVTWQGGEGTSVNAADQTLGQLSMTPKTAIVITDVSEQLLRQSNPSAEAFVMADLASDIAIDGVDYAVINGAGGAQPLGIKNTTGVSTGQDAASITYAKALAFPTTAGSANAIRGNPGWVTNIAGAAVCMQRQRFSSTDTPLWEGNLLDGTLVGFRAMSSEQLASGNLIFGSWDEVVIGEWGVLELATDNGGTRFNQAQVGIRAMWMVDVMLRYPQSFVVSTNLS